MPRLEFEFQAHRDCPLEIDALTISASRVRFNGLLLSARELIPWRLGEQDQ